ncbi:sensor histidine kinase [Alicyclobacillus herbarius]|uniref:sensor histidine kinase n=1 Tax=Alicyclobacillus herbarius TaxID=122960 RepID=UPI0003FB5436|nr:HAMP domain-containing sensor histidine kinase [Alicyclobacillus herbarius]
MFNRVRLQLTALTVTLFAVLYALSAYAIFSIVHRAVLHNVDSQLIYAIHQFEGNPGHLTSLPPNTYFVIQEGPVVNSNAGYDLVTFLQHWLQQQKQSQSVVADVHGPHQTMYRIYYQPILGDDDHVSVYVLLAQNVNREWSVLFQLRAVLWWVGATGALAAAVLGFWLAARALLPIRQAYQRQTEFVADASHELRTPLAVIQSNLDIVLSHSDESVMDNLEWIQNARGEARRLAKLVEDLLTLARQDADRALLHQERVEADSLVRRLIELFLPLADAKNVHLSADVEPGILVWGDPDRLHQLLVILLDNAIKYNRPGGRVWIRVETSRNWAVFRVEDTGIGIPEADVPKVFDRFYRADPARQHEETTGAGLGLSMAKWIVDAHKGRIRVDSTEGKGTTVTVQLPLASRGGDTDGPSHPETLTGDKDGG